MSKIEKNVFGIREEWVRPLPTLSEMFVNEGAQYDIWNVIRQQAGFSIDQVDQNQYRIIIPTSVNAGAPDMVLSVTIGEDGSIQSISQG